MRNEQGHAAAPEQALDEAPKAKRPYNKPSFREERVFETMALNCGKTVGGTQEQCQLSPKTS
jgi:hypothetical protein